MESDTFLYGMRQLSTTKSSCEYFSPRRKKNCCLISVFTINRKILFRWTDPLRDGNKILENKLYFIIQQMHSESNSKTYFHWFQVIKVHLLLFYTIEYLPLLLFECLRCQ